MQRKVFFTITIVLSLFMRSVHSEFDLNLDLAEDSEQKWIPNLNLDSDGEDDEDFVVDLKFIESNIMRSFNHRNLQGTGGDECAVENCEECEYEPCDKCNYIYKYNIFNILHFFL